MANYLQSHNQNSINYIFGALADPTRRNILERLTRKNLTVTEIAKPYGFSLPTISKHLTVLEKAKLVARVKNGRIHTVHIIPATMRTVAEYINFYTKFWNTELDKLEKFLMKEVNNK